MAYSELLNQLHQWSFLQVSASALTVTPSILTQVLTTLLIGVLTALAFQLLLACFGIAIGISAFQPPSLTTASNQVPDAHAERPAEDAASRSGVGVWLGVGILFTFNSVLFAASFLATKFSQIHSPIEGAIAGIVIWSAYFLLLLWLSSTAVSSLLGMIISLTTVGFRRIVATIMAPFGVGEEPIQSMQLVETIRQELKSVLDDMNVDDILEEKIQQQLAATSFQVSQLKPASVETVTTIPTIQPAVTTFWAAIADYLSQADAKKLTAKRLERKLQKSLQTLQAELPKDTILSTFNPTLIESTLKQRQDLSEKKKQRITAQLESIWNTFIQTDSLTSNEPETTADHFDEIDHVEQEDSSLKQTTQISQVVLDAVGEQVLNHLPAIAQRLEANLPEWKMLAPLVLPIAREKVIDFLESVTDGASNSPSDGASNAMNVKEVVQQTVQPSIEQAIETSQAGIAVLNRTVSEQLESLRDRASERMESLQRMAEEQTNHLRLQAQQRLDATRKAAVTAIWWLFMTAFTGAISAAFSGAIASGFNPLTIINSW